MAEKDYYYITVKGKRIDVSKEVYTAHQQMERAERTLEERDKRNGLLHYEELTTISLSGEEIIHDLTQESVEELVIAEIMKKRLRESIQMLSEKEKTIIEAYYFDGLTERQIAKGRDVSQTTIHRYRKKAIEKLKKLLKG